MFQLRKSENVLITRDLANTFAAMAPSPTERPFSEKRLKFLQGKFDSHLFIPCQWSSAWLGGTQLRMNGQHSSHMLSKLPDPFPTNLRAYVDEYEVADPGELVDLFKQFDVRESARSASDVAGAYQYTFPELMDIPAPIAKIGIEGIAWYLRVIEGVPTGKGDERYRLFRQPVHYDFLHWLMTVLDMKTPEMRKIEVIAAMYATDLVVPKDSQAFWEEVARGGKTYEEQDPTTVLDKWLKACREGKCDDTMRQAFHYQGCVYAWNAFREGRTIKDIKFNTSKGLYVPMS